MTPHLVGSCRDWRLGHYGPSYHTQEINPLARPLQYIMIEGPGCEYDAVVS